MNEPRATIGQPLEEERFAFPAEGLELTTPDSFAALEAVASMPQASRC